MTYDEWIAAFRAEYGDGECLCWYATEDLQRAFPELKRVYGKVAFVLSDSKIDFDYHVWCEAPDGTIVDPTATQFGGEILERIPSRWPPEYERARCPSCQLHTYDLEPLPTNLHMFASLQSGALGAWTLEGVKPVPHSCQKEQTH